MSPASEVNAADPRGLEKKLLVRGLTSFVDDVKVISGKQELIDATSQTRHFHGFETGAKVPSAKDPSAESFNSSPLSVLSLPVNLYLICSKLFQRKIKRINNNIG